MWFQSTRPRGARRVLHELGAKPDDVSIHAPAWGATRQGTLPEWSWNTFQSTRPRGARPRPRRFPPRYAKCFNPRARVGRDLSVQGSPSMPEGFNPRARVGRDLFALPTAFAPMRFQSTRPRGARLAGRGEDVEAPEVSIHAPAWGATDRRDDDGTPAVGVSIHAPAWGATRSAVGCRPSG